MYELLLGAEGTRVKVSPLFFVIIICVFYVLNFLNFARLQSLNSDWAWVLKVKICCTIYSRWCSGGLGRLIRKGWIILMFFGFFSFYSFAPVKATIDKQSPHAKIVFKVFFFCFLLILSRALHYTDTSLTCCQSDDRYAESTRKIVVPERIQRGRNFVILKLAEDIKLRRK